MTATPAEQRSKGSAASARYLSLVAEREPSLERLLRERDPWPELYTPLTTYVEQNIRGLVREWRDE